MGVNKKWDWLEENLVRFNNGLFEPEDCLESGCIKILDLEDPVRADETYDEICQYILEEIGAYPESDDGTPKSHTSQKIPGVLSCMT